MLWDHFIVRREEQLQRRIKYFGIIISVVLFFISIRLAYMQFIQVERYRELSARNRVRLVPIKAQRGFIYDRHSELLVGNIPAFSVSIIPAVLPQKLSERQVVFSKLEKMLGISVAEIEKKIQNRKLRYFEPIRLKSNVDRDTTALIEEHRLQLPGVVVLTESLRKYNFDSLAFHALGYVGEISEKELALREGYQSGDIIGQSGVEKIYDHYLKGRNGWLHIEVDAIGRQLGILGREDPWPGHNLILTLDHKLQQCAEGLLKKHKGVIIVSDLRNGEILTLASSPTFNPNLFARGLSKNTWRRLCRSQHYPLTNRCTQGLYPPGSIFKIVTLLAALEERIITPYKKFSCKGTFWISTWPYRCWRDKGHGSVNAYRSLVESCDIFYYNIGLKIKVEKLGKWAKIFGYGSPTGIDLPNELSGLVPTAQWKEQTQNMPWFPGNTVMMSIGQGYILSTPMQLLNTVVAVANKGVIYKPHLLKEVRTNNNRLLHELKPEVLYKIKASEKNWRLLRKALKGVVNARRGTGYYARVDKIIVAGKTATSQNPHGDDHAGFVAYAPANNPEIAVVVYIENAGGGGTVAAPLARKMVEAYFGLSELEENKTE